MVRGPVYILVSACPLEVWKYPGGCISQYLHIFDHPIVS
jgi:hypothetical protein